MDFTTLSGFLSLTGTLVQCAVACLTVLLFALLGRYAARRPYFTAWTAAWAVLLVSILALVVRYYIMPGPSRAPGARPSLSVQGLYFVYQFGKLVFAVLLVHGTRLYLDLRDGRRFLLLAIPALAAVAAVTVSVADSLNQIVAWQSALLAPAFGYCAFQLLRGRQRPRTLGTSLVGGCFALLTVLWMLYFLAFTRVAFGSAGSGNPFALFTINNSFIDTLAAMLLTMGMIVLLMEDATREMDQLRARRQAEAAQAQRMEAVGQLVSGIAHELNNPLAAVLNFSEILLHDPRGEHDRLALSTIREQARRCRSVVRNLQTFVREGAIRRQPLVLHEIVERVVRAFEPEQAQFGIRCVVELPPDLPPLEADCEALEQVFTNLISNSLHAIGRFGEVRIQATDQGEWIHLTVEDDGPGIPPAMLGRVFDPFFSGQASGRTGLGLSVSQGIVALHGGTIIAENRPAPERGARVRFTLPVHPRERAAIAAGTARPPERAADLAIGPGKRAMLVEDEAAIRSALRRYLERAGWRVEECDGAREALERLTGDSAATSYDLVISDLRMPDMSGIELHDRLKRDNPAILARFIFITGDVASAEASAFIAATDRPVLEKPFELDALAAAVREVAGGRLSV
jgi:signal transduction histidine kinase/CheY-like chemotaxis protein